MRKFSTLNESVVVEVEKNKIQTILSNLSIQSDTDLTTHDVKIIGLSEVETQLNQHIDEVKRDVVFQTIQYIEESLKTGQSWNLIIEKIKS